MQYFLLLVPNGYDIVEDVPLEALERPLVPLARQPLVLIEEHAYGKDKDHALVVVRVVVVLVRDAVDALVVDVCPVWLLRSYRGGSRTTVCSSPGASRSRIRSRQR